MRAPHCAFGSGAQGDARPQPRRAAAPPSAAAAVAEHGRRGITREPIQTNSRSCSTSLPRPAAPGTQGARGALPLGFGPVPAADHASLAATRAAARTIAQEEEGPPRRAGGGANPVGCAGRGGAAARGACPAPFARAFAESDGRAPLRGRLRSEGRPRAEAGEPVAGAAVVFRGLVISWWSGSRYLPTWP